MPRHRTTVSSDAVSRIVRVHDSPVGPLVLCATRAGAGEPVLTGLFFDDDPRARDARSVPTDARLADDDTLTTVRRELDAYFAGRLRTFTFPIAFDEGTPFQRAVWRALGTIPYGQTWSYAELARAIGRPRAVRAVGAANGRNPLAIVLPCHRVIGADGRLVGYGGGLPRKAALLELEGRRG
ncbi:MAG: methylated-DNA--[protein]-cysteine S-methyltransferase [Sandaracinaceae bacterium]|nr:methylated-DNA--[protein]-cysteine S-methyltransferase [Sandaracinaceae bacterium]